MKGFLPKKNKILVHVKDKSCNSLQDFRPATLLKRLQHGCFPVNIPKALATFFYRATLVAAFKLCLSIRNIF